jgi:endonuclease YncB( thermonuclease family)
MSEKTLAGVTIFIVLAGFLASSLAAGGPDRVPGPVLAQLVRVIDGDTIEVTARIWLGQNLRTRVRLAGIDAPEMKGACLREIALAHRARQALADRLEGGPVTLRDIHYGKYAGRVVAQVFGPAGTDVGAMLLARSLARPYAGRGRADWCAGRADVTLR